MNNNLPIIMYHHVVPAAEVWSLAPFAVSRELFSRQMDLLQARGYRTLTLSEMCDQLDGDAGRQRGKFVALTFDDCPAALLDFAVPELVRRGMTATFFAVAGRLGGVNDWDAGSAPTLPLMSAGELRTLVVDGFEIGSHGLNHLHLRECSSEAVSYEMRESRRWLQECVGESVDFFAYPFGEYPADHVKLCREAGYRGAVSIFSDSRTGAADRYGMRRVLVHEGDESLRFRLKMGPVYLWLRRYVDRWVLRSNNV